MKNIFSSPRRSDSIFPATAQESLSGSRRQTRGLKVSQSTGDDNCEGDQPMRMFAAGQPAESIMSWC